MKAVIQLVAVDGSDQSVTYNHWCLEPEDEEDIAFIRQLIGQQKTGHIIEAELDDGKLSIFAYSPPGPTEDA